MRQMKAFLAGVAALVVLPGALPADAGMGSVPAQLRVATHKEGPYQQFSPHATVKGKAKSFYFKIINKDNHDMGVTLEDNSIGADLADFKVRWFRGKQDITDDVDSAGHNFNLKVAKAKVFEGRVKPRVADPGEMCLGSGFHVEPDDFNTGGSVYINDDGVCG